MASNSRASSSSCSSLKRASGLSIVVDIASSSESEFDLDRALGGVDARAHRLALGPGHLAVAQVAHPAGRERADAGVADALAAAEGQLEPLVLPGDEDRGATVALDLLAALGKADGAALALLGAADD